MAASRCDASADLAGRKLFVADNGNSRVLGWNALPTTGAAADALAVIDQSNARALVFMP